MQGGQGGMMGGMGQGPSSMPAFAGMGYGPAQAFLSSLPGVSGWNWGSGGGGNGMLSGLMAPRAMPSQNPNPFGFAPGSASSASQGPMFQAPLSIGGAASNALPPNVAAILAHPFVPPSPTPGVSVASTGAGPSSGGAGPSGGYGGAGGYGSVGGGRVGTAAQALNDAFGTHLASNDLSSAVGKLGALGLGIPGLGLVTGQLVDAANQDANSRINAQDATAAAVAQGFGTADLGSFAADTGVGAGFKDPNAGFSMAQGINAQRYGGIDAGNTSGRYGGSIGRDSFGGSYSSGDRGNTGPGGFSSDASRADARGDGYGGGGYGGGNGGSDGGGGGYSRGGTVRSAAFPGSAAGMTIAHNVGAGSGLIGGAPQGGKTDASAVSVPRGGFVIPADAVSALGQGDTASGAKAWGSLIGAVPTKDPSAKGPAATLIRAASGEFYVDPRHVALLGGGDPEKGAAVLRELVSNARAKAAASLNSEPGPKP